ncbi:MAG: universal stress protein [bacterium]|nr:hypothetical protein [Gammaproteobacteria bacterium]HIL95681.1 hypothetical protein [Pseudomonadales bacterium]
MLGVDRILVAIDHTEGAIVVLEKALALATASNAALEVVHVIYEGIVDIPVKQVENNQELKTFLMQSAETWLEDQLDPIRNKVKSLESATIWNKDKWHGILAAAEESRADLIIKGADRADEFGVKIRTPQDWNLLRHSEIPVMLVKDVAWVSSPTIIAAVDALNEDQFALSKRVLVEAAHLASILEGELTIVVAYPLVEAWAEPTAIMLDFEKLQAEIEQEIKISMNRLVKESNVDYKYLQISEGGPAMRIRDSIEDSQAELLVMGTVGRSGVKSFVIGNTSETILTHTHCDVVVLR